MNKELATSSTLSHYRIVSKIGAGGMGEVYLAQDSRLDRKVALKILPADLAANQDRMRRFVQEAKAAAALNHPNIAHIYEIGDHEGTHFIAMEFVDGITLRAKIHDEKSELRTLLKHLLQVADGLAKAHGSGIVHRDLKPDNIMITRDGHAKILDFGLAKLLESMPESVDETGEAATAMMPVQHSTPGVVMGTVGYMSPEQARAKPVDERSDVFSFGCVLYEAATGHKPFVGDSTVDTLHKIIHDPAPAITDYNSAAPPDLQRIIRKCLAKEPAKRYQTVRDVANDLEELIEELKGLSDIERSIAPPTLSQHSLNSGAGGTTTDVNPAPSTTSVSHPASSAEFIVSGIQRHKLGVGIALAALVVVGALFGYYLYARNSKTTIGSIAVLPFQNRNSDANTEYLSDGLAESLIYRLSQLPGLKVSPTTSVLRYKGRDVDPQKIAAELNVDAVMSGRLVQRGEDLTISVELIDARNNKLLWGEQYERKMADLLATQREIASAIVDKLQLRLSGNDSKGITRPYTSNNEAYQLYLQGRYLWNKRSSGNIKKATELLRAATEKDPQFALAYAGLADCYAVSYYYVGERNRELMPFAKTYASKAIELDPTLAEPHATLGFARWLLDWDRAGAEKEFLRAIELNPNYPTAHHWYSRYLRGIGRTDEAFREIKRAEELDPLSLVIINNIAEMYIHRGDLNATARECQRMIDLDPNFWAAHQTLGILLVKQGLYPEALLEAQKSINLSSRSNASLALLGHVYARLGRRSEAEAVIKELEKRHADKLADGRDLVVVYAGLEDKDKAFAWLEKAFEDHSVFLVFLKLEPLMETLHSDPRWSELERRVGISK